MGSQVKKAEYARKRGVSRGRVTQYVSLGMPVLNNGMLDVVACDAWVAKNVDTTRQQKPDKQQNQAQILDLNRERARLAKEQADKTAMENDVRRGDLIPRSDFVKTMQAAFVHCRAKLLAIPSKMAPVMARVETALEAQDRLTAAINETLAELASIRVVPEDSGGDDSGGGADGGDGGMGSPAQTDGKRVGRPKPKAQPRSKRRAG